MDGQPQGEEANRLLALVAAGDRAAFADLYDLVGSRVFGLARRVVVQQQLAEDVAQEALVQVWRDAARFDPQRGSAMAWILTITHRRAVDAVRSAVSQSAREAAYESRVGSRPVDETSEQVVARDEARQVHRVLADLGPPHQEAVELAYLEGLTHREVAERLGIPLGTAKTRIRDGMAKLRRSVEEGDRLRGAPDETGEAGGLR